MRWQEIIWDLVWHGGFAVGLMGTHFSVTKVRNLFSIEQKKLQLMPNQRGSGKGVGGFLGRKRESENGWGVALR